MNGYRLLLFGFTVVISCLGSVSIVQAADINLRITNDGKIVGAEQGKVGEIYRGWRHDVLFASLSSQIKSHQSVFTVSIQSDIGALNTINPRLYAIHGAQAVPTKQTDSIREWSVAAPTGSHVTIVADVKPGLFATPLPWQIIAMLAKIPDLLWFVMASLLPLLTLFLFSARSLLLRRQRPLASQLDHNLLYASPAALTVLLRGFISRRATAATLVDLARRRHLRLLVRQDRILLFRRMGQDELRPHEQLLLERWFGSGWSSNATNFNSINLKGTAIHLSIYAEVNRFRWFRPNPLISHWKILVAALLLTIFSSVTFIVIFIFVPSALPLLWFLGGSFVTVAVLYAFSPTYTHLTTEGKRARSIMLSSARFLANPQPIQPLPAEHTAWEDWLPLAMVLGVAKDWLKRWEKTPFLQPDWFMTAEPLRGFDEFMTQLDPVLRAASEGIRDKILPAYL